MNTTANILMSVFFGCCDLMHFLLCDYRFCEFTITFKGSQHKNNFFIKQIFTVFYFNSYLKYQNIDNTS